MGVSENNVIDQALKLKMPRIDLNPEKHFKQTKLEKGKKKNCVVCTKLQDNIRVCTSYICGECNVALCIGECWEKYNTKKVL